MLVTEEHPTVLSNKPRNTSRPRTAAERAPAKLPHHLGAQQHTRRCCIVNMDMMALLQILGAQRHTKPRCTFNTNIAALLQSHSCLPCCGRLSCPRFVSAPTCASPHMRRQTLGGPAVCT